MNTTTKNNFPKHIAIIMDGNGRWAQQHNLKRRDGHSAGSKNAKKIVTACRELGVEYLTLYAFSKENWQRPEDEIGFLFQLLVSFLQKELKHLIKNDIRFVIFGDLEHIPASVQKILLTTVDKTKNNTSMTVNLAFNYSGRTEILNAAQSILKNHPPDTILTEELFRSYLYSQTQPDPDIIIRTSGEQRLSNYLTFQSAYSELYFTNTLWPDFTKEELSSIIKDYETRNRRFGLTQEQIDA